MTVSGPHNASLTVTPPAAGAPWAQYNITICLSALPTDCFEKQCTASGTTPCTVDVNDGSCLSPATTCLRAETEYTATATATNQAGVVSLASSPTNFTTPGHRRVRCLPALPAARLRLLALCLPRVRARLLLAAARRFARCLRAHDGCRCLHPLQWADDQIH